LSIQPPEKPTMNSHHVFRSSAAALLLLVAGHAMARAEQEPSPDSGLHGSLGLGIGVKPEYPGAKDRESRFQPSVSLFYGDTFFLTGGTAGVNLLRQQIAGGTRITAGPLLAWRSGRKESEHAELAGLGDIQRGLDAGGFVGLQMGEYYVRTEVLKDFTNDNGGSTLTLSAGRGWTVAERLHLHASADATWASADHMNLFYGVDATQSANSGLTQYQADAGGKSIGLNLKADYRITREWGAFASARYSRLVGDAATSPIVSELGSRDQASATVGIRYRF